MRSARDAEMSGFGRLPTESEMMAFDTDPAPLERPKPRAAEQPWLGRAELAAAGFHDLEHETIVAPLTAEVPLDDFHDTQPTEDEHAGRFEPTQPWSPPAGEGAAVAQTTSQTAAHAPASEAGDGFVPLDLPPAAPSAPAVARPAAAPRRAIETEDEIEARTRATLARLRMGDWVDLRVRNDWRRSQLVWHSENGSLFMFVSHGGRPHSMTRRTCEKLIRARYLRLVDAGAVVDKALRSLGSRDDAAKGPAAA
jgi:hypothetical protein